MRPLIQTIENFLTAVPWLWIALWLGIAGLAITLMVLMLTRWGQSDPMRKCIVLAILAHVLLAGYAATVQIVASSGSPLSDEPITMILVDLPSEESLNDDTRIEPIEKVPQESMVPEPADQSELDVPTTTSDEPWTVQPTEPRPKVVEEPTVRRQAATTTQAVRRQATTSRVDLPKLEVAPQPLDLTSPELANPAPAIASRAEPTRPRATIAAAKIRDDVNTATIVPPLASAYRSRAPQQRRALLEKNGGDEDTEAAVAAAIAWLAAAQQIDGHWDARREGAGREQKVDGQDRSGAGSDADTGVSSLALLAMLGAGHTHQHGPYAENVKAGLRYLLRSQGADGNLYGGAGSFARMYCHAMATFALSEAYAMTRDRKLRPAVERAVAFSMKAQNTTTGGWRYQPGDTGDTSQHGWHLMSLRSAQQAGIEVPNAVFDRANRFLNTVASGRAGGLASYRPQQMPTRTMTAEALFCRQLLGHAEAASANNEAAEYLLQTLPGEMLPGESTPNFYYCYYGTVSMFQMQGVYWRQWNSAVKGALIKLQSEDGSWSSATRWGGYGGKIYTTAMGAMCLEVYYRYLPFYREAQLPARRLK